MMRKNGAAMAALAEAFPLTLPIFAGFWFIAFAYGFYMNTLGFSWVYPMAMAAIIFGGSLEFVTISMLLSSFAPIETFVVAFTVQARHLFYGIPMLEKYAGTGWKKPFLIYMMCDETFALNYSATIPYSIDKGWFYFWVSLLNFLYWCSGAAIGGLLGGLISFDTKGLSFVMTTMFLVIFLEQWMKEKKISSCPPWASCSSSRHCIVSHWKRKEASDEPASLLAAVRHHRTLLSRLHAFSLPSFSPF